MLGIDNSLECSLKSERNFLRKGASSRDTMPSLLDEPTRYACTSSGTTCLA